MKTRLTERFDNALELASDLHRDQFRKGSGIPYLSHLLAVSALVLENGGDEDQAIAALLHDAVEDQGGLKTLEEIRKRFGNRVADIVWGCTDAHEDPKPEWRSRKEVYLAKLPSRPDDSLLVSLSDKVHNARSIRDDYREIGDSVWDRFKGGKKDGTLWYYQELTNFFSKRMPGRLANELAAAVADFSDAE